MFGSFFTKLGEKMHEQAADGQGDAQSASNDIFSMLAQPQPANKRPAGKYEDPLNYFLSPDPKSTAMPHVSKQKPAIVTNNTQEGQQSSQNEMQAIDLFGQTKTEQPVHNAWEEEPSLESSEEEEEEEQMPPAPAPAATRKRDYLSNLMSTAGSLIKQGATKASNKLTAEDEDKVISVLTKENEQLKEMISEQQEKVEELHDEIVVHQSLEEEAHEQNEELIYKVTYLEELARDNGNDLAHLKKVEQVTQEKKSLQQQVDSLERQLTMLEKMKFSKKALDKDDQAEYEQMFQNPKRTLYDLKSLFEHNKISFCRSDENRVLTALYTQQKPVIRLYRELLFRQIAQKAVQSAESLFKQTNSLDRDGNQMCKLSLENKRLLAQNEALKKQLAGKESSIEQLKDDMSYQKARSAHKLGLVQTKAENLQTQISDLKDGMHVLQASARSLQETEEDQEVLNMNIQRFSSYLNYFLGQEREKQSQLRVTQKESYKQLLGEKNDVLKQLQLAKVEHSEVSKQLDQEKNERVNLQEELGEAQESISHLEIEVNQQFESFEKERSSRSKQEDQLKRELQQLQQTVENERNQRVSQETQLRSEIEGLRMRESLLQQEVQNLQQLPQGSPMSGEQLPPQPEASAESQDEVARQTQHISELEKMLEEREEEIIELMSEVNKLQEKEQQSPEVVQFLQILKSKLTNSQQKFQDQQQNAGNNIHEKVASPQPLAATRAKEQKTQHVPILIEDQAPVGGTPSDNSPRPNKSPYMQEDVPRNQQTTDSFNSNVRAKLEEVQIQRMEQSPQQPAELFSRIVKDGKDSNFFSSMVHETSAEKQEPQTAKVNDLFGFLMEPLGQVKEKPSHSINQINNWGEAFGLNPSGQSNQQAQSEPPQTKESPGQNASEKHGGWGDADEDDLNLEEEPTDQIQSPVQIGGDDNAQEAEQIQIGLDLSHESQRGEIMFQESLENSPIKQNRTLEGMDSAKDIFANQHAQPQTQTQDQDPSQLGSLIYKNMQQTEEKSAESQSPQQDTPTDLKSSSQQRSGTSSHHKRTKRISQNPKEAFLDGSLEYLGHDIQITGQFDPEMKEIRIAAEDDEQNQSYRAAITSLAEQEGRETQNTHDIDPEVYNQLMFENEEESKSQSAASDSMLHNSSNSPWNNSFTRQESEMVVATIRKESMHSQENSKDYSPLLYEEKRVNISNLSDLIPEDPTPEKMTEEEEELYYRALKPGGELNEIDEEDEDISDDLSSMQQKSLPTSIHERADSNTILDMQMSNKTRKISMEYISLKNSDQVGHVSTPSMNEEIKFETLMQEKDNTFGDQQSLEEDAENQRVPWSQDFFSKKIAYVLGVDQASGLEPIDNIDGYLTEAQEALKEWAGDFDEITVVNEEIQMPQSWLETEFAKIQNYGTSETILVALYFKGHSRLTDGCVTYLGRQEGEGANGLENFLRTCGTLSNVYPLGIFDCCRLEPEPQTDTLSDSVNNILCVYRDQVSDLLTGCSCEEKQDIDSLAKKVCSQLRAFEDIRSSDDPSLVPHDLSTLTEKTVTLLKGWKVRYEKSPEDYMEKENKSLQLHVPLDGEIQPMKQATSARAHHRRNESIGKNPFMIMNIEQESHPTAESAQSAETPKQQQFDNLAEFTKENLIQYQEDGKTEETNFVEDTADFENSKEGTGSEQAQQELEESKDGFKSTEASGYFTRDFRVLRFATYGNDDGAQRIQRKLDEEYGIINESQDMAARHEQNVQSFAEPPPSEVELSGCSIDVNELQGEGNFQMMQMMQNSMNDSRGSFENNFRASFERNPNLDPSKLNSFCGSLIIPNTGSIVEAHPHLLNNQDSIEEYEDEHNGIPDVAVYNENSLEQPQFEDYPDNEIDEQEVGDQVETCLSAVGDEDSQSLETVQEDKSAAEISPHKQPVRTMPSDENLLLADEQLLEDPERIVQSNHQDDDQVAGEANEGKVAAGWEDDESLEEIDNLGDDPQEDQLENEELNRSVSANEQVSDAVEVARDPVLEQEEELTSSQEQLLQKGMEGLGSGLSRNQEQRRDTPIPKVEINLDCFEEKKQKVKGWADVSDDISISEDPSMTEAVQEQSLENLKESLNSPLLNGEGDLSQTAIAEIGESSKFSCPNGHKLTIVDGKMHPLPDQECSAYCGMANQQNSKNWLRCRECFYKVCHECFHCGEGHEMSTAKSEDFPDDPEFCELLCASCGSEIQGKLWVCEVIASALLKSPTTPAQCSDKSLICQECLGAGNSLAISKNQISKQDLFSSPLKNNLQSASKEKSEEVGESAQNEQTSQSAEKKNPTDFNDIFGMALTQQTEALDPFQAFLTAKKPEEEKAEIAQQPGDASAEIGGEAETEVGGTGGGWGDADDDIDIDD